MKGYLGCKKCIEEKRPDPSEIKGEGQIYIFKSSGCTIKCRHHRNDLEWIQEACDIRNIEQRNL